MLNYFNCPSQVFFNPLLSNPGVSLINPGM